MGHDDYHRSAPMAIGQIVYGLMKWQDSEAISPEVEPADCLGELRKPETHV